MNTASSVSTTDAYLPGICSVVSQWPLQCKHEVSQLNVLMSCIEATCYTVLGQRTSITLFVACVCAVYPKVPAVDFMPSQIANGTLSCIFVIIFTEAKSFLSSSLSVCH